MSDRIAIVAAEGAERIGMFRALCVEYQASLPFSLCFQGFDAEMAGLPGKYARPGGRMYVAVVGEGGGERGVGCGAIRPLEEGVCELKRMYVVEGYRGQGIARAIATRLMEDARAIGYAEMKLDTSGDMVAAQRLYRSLGFTEVERYNDDPMEDTLYFGCRL